MSGGDDDRRAQNGPSAPLVPRGWGRFFGPLGHAQRQVLPFNVAGRDVLIRICPRSPLMVVGEAASVPFQMTMGPERLSGTLNLTTQEDADEVIKMLTVMKVFLKPKDAAAN